MSTENRNKVLLGFGALVAVVIVAIALWPANFRKEDASGAIGAVQKHRAPQITQKDVILGDETVRHEQKVLYTDFLADASKLQAMALNVRGARENAQREIAALRDELKVRYADEVNEVLARAGSRADTAAMKAEVDQLRAKAAAVREMSEAEMAQYEARLGHLAAEDDSLYGRIKMADQDLAAATTQLNSRPMEAARELAAAEMALDARASAIRLADEVDFAMGLRKELKALDDVADLYAKKVADEDNIAGRLVMAANELEARAIKNIEAGFELNVKTAAALDRLDQKFAAAKSAFAGRANMESRTSEAVAKNIGAVSQALARTQSAFREHATSAVRGELVAIRAMVDSRKEANAAALQHQLQAMESRLESRGAFARYLNDEFVTEVRALRGRSEELRAKAAQ